MPDRVARDDLEITIAPGTAEVLLANEELAALRRVATLVAEGVQHEYLFAVVAEEVAGVVDVPIVSVVRYEPDGTATECGSFSAEGPRFSVGTRWSLDGTNVLRLIRDTAKPARIDDYEGLDGETAAVVRAAGIRSRVGTPIVVAGRLWGAMVVSSDEPAPLAEGTEAQLADFTELLGTAIANAESREAVRRLAEEQASLRRVATLVARGVPAPAIFNAVSNEVLRLLETDSAYVGVFDADGPAIVAVGVASTVDAVTVGARWELDDTMSTAAVYRTGRSARVDDVDYAATTAPVGELARSLGTACAVSSPIIVDGKLWGAVSVAARHALPRDTEERLDKFTDLIATGLANADARSEVEASRRRIVAASDDARRRIERNLHDGTQQRLVALALAVRAAETNVPPSLPELRAELSNIVAGLGDAVAELQEVARGIHPANLSESGLGPALRTLARRSPVPVDLDLTLADRLPEPIEVAAYYVASEALANATKHSHASYVGVSLSLDESEVRLSVCDDGVGGAEPTRGTGLVGLTDRVEALGGTVEVCSAPGEGTRITATLPLDWEPRTDAE